MPLGAPTVTYYPPRASSGGTVGPQGPPGPAGDTGPAGPRGGDGVADPALGYVAVSFK